jgi:hypothetical protein
MVPIQNTSLVGRANLFRGAALDISALRTLLFYLRVLSGILFEETKLRRQIGYPAARSAVRAITMRIISGVPSVIMWLR